MKEILEMKRSIKNRTVLRRCIAPTLLAVGLQIGAEQLLRAQTTANQSQLAAADQAYISKANLRALSASLNERFETT